MAWYRLGLAEGTTKLNTSAWQLAWDVSQAEAGHDPGNAIFQKGGPNGQLTLFFTPSSRLLAESFGAEPCAKPSPSGLILVAGSEQARGIHFGRVFGVPGIGAFKAFHRRIPPGQASAREFEEHDMVMHRAAPRHNLP